MSNGKGGTAGTFAPYFLGPDRSVASYVAPVVTTDFTGVP